MNLLHWKHVSLNNIIFKGIIVHFNIGDYAFIFKKGNLAMKFLKNIAFLLCLVMVFSLFSCNEPTNNSDVSIDTSNVSTETSEPESESFTIPSHISGTFIQPWLYNNWNEDRWEKEFAIWNKLGFDTIILGDTASIKLSDYSITTYYPSKIEGANKSTDYLTKLFEQCKKHGYKLYIGMGNTAEGWPFFDFGNSKNKEIFREVCNRFALIAEDIYNIYYEDYSDVFAGFYFVPEMYNSSMFDTDANRAIYVDGMAYGLEVVFEKLNSLNSDIPFIFSPYLNIFGGSWVSKNSENIGKFWTDFLREADFRDGDILCPQDSCGAGGMDVEHLEEYTKMYQKATQDCGKKIQFWSNCETFIQPNDDFISRNEGVNYWGSATVKRMVSQFEITGKYASKIITFAFPHYQSPYNNVSGFYETYLNYLQTGNIDNEKPTAPDKIRTVATSSPTSNGKKSLTVYFSGMYDNFGISRINIYKNGEFFTFRLPTRVDGGSTLPYYINNFFDDSFDLESESAVYEFEVIDCAGNISEKSSFTIKAEEIPNKVRLDKIYSCPSDDKYR